MTKAWLCNFAVTKRSLKRIPRHKTDNRDIMIPPPLDNTNIRDLVINLLVGILVTLLDRFIIYSNKILRNYKFKMVFGNDLNSFNIVYGRMVLKPKYASNDRFPYVKGNNNVQFSMSNPVSFTETKSSKYLTESFSKLTGKAPTLISDDELAEKLDISYCSLGGLSNSKTNYILQSFQNKFFEFNPNNNFIRNKRDSQNNYIHDQNFDYAVIIKIKNKIFPKRTQICVAGLGEWGTSGGSWFLANKWKEIRKKVGDKEFGAVIRVMNGLDESAEMVEIIK